MEPIRKEVNNLAHYIESMIKTHLTSQKTSEVSNLHDMLLEQIEPPLFKAVIEHCRYNQCRAATMLGLSRGTLRMKLIKYFNDKYCGRREEEA